MKNIEWCNYAHPSWFDWATVWNKWPHRLFHNLICPSVLTHFLLSLTHIAPFITFVIIIILVVIIWSEGLTVFLWTQPFWVMSLRLNLERKVRMDSTCRRCLGHCLIVNLTLCVLNTITGSSQTERQAEDVCWRFKGVLYYMGLLMRHSCDIQTWFD